MRSYSYYLLLGIIALGLIIFFALNRSDEQKVLLLSGAGMKVPVYEIAQNFEKETGIKVNIQLGGSSILRNYILDFKTGDLFLPGDKKNLDLLSEADLVVEGTFMAWHSVAILVAPQAKDRIKSLDDLAKPGVRLVMSNPELASLGKIVTQKIIKKHPKGEEILKNVVVYGSSSQDVLKLYKEGNIDALIEWDVMTNTPEGKDLIVVPIEEKYQVKDQLFVGLLKTAEHPELARKFYDYMKIKGKMIFKKHGYNTEPL